MSILIIFPSREIVWLTQDRTWPEGHSILAGASARRITIGCSCMLSSDMA